MIRRLYIHNFKCLVNFELILDGMSSVLLIGRNGVGKSSVLAGLEVLQKLARGTNRISSLISPKDITWQQAESPVRWEVEATISAKHYTYSLAVQLPPGTHEMRILEERLHCDGTAVYSRTLADVSLPRSGESNSVFNVDWHLAALPIIQDQSGPVATFRNYMARMILLAPEPRAIGSVSMKETLEPEKSLSNFAAWISGLLAYAPAVYSRIDQFLKAMMPDFRDVVNPNVGKDARELSVRFGLKQQASLEVSFSDLSDGEKCFVIGAVALAAHEAYGPLVCVWDEPDCHLALSEVGHFMLALRSQLGHGGQFIACSHDPEAIRAFSTDSTMLLYRNSHFEPTKVRKISAGETQGDLVAAMTIGDL